MNADEIGLGLHPGQAAATESARSAPPVTTSMPRMAMLAPNLKLKVLPILRRDDQHHLHHVVPLQEPLGRMQPDGLVGQRGERLLVVLVPEPAAASGGRQNYGKLRHAIRKIGCQFQGTATGNPVGVTVSLPSMVARPR